MIDRFKFRVWRIKENCYNHQKPSSTCCILENGLLAYFDEETQMQNYIIEQCTELKDKNGKLIYEGDIIQIKFDSDGIAGPYSVVWDCEEYAFILRPTKGDDYDCDRHLYEFSANRIEVIGNIHEMEDNHDF